MSSRHAQVSALLATLPIVKDMEERNCLSYNVIYYHVSLPHISMHLHFQY